MAVVDEAEALDTLDLEHTGPATLAGVYLRTFWQPIYASADLQVGKPKPIRVMSEDLTLYRGQSGAPYVIDFRCAHRGTQLSAGWIEGDTLRCYYHGWLYDGTGQCLAQPCEDEGFAQKIKILSYPVQEYAGLIFIYMGPKPEPPLPRYRELDQEGWALDPGVSAVPCNYFQRIENNVDPAHVPFVHRMYHYFAYVEKGSDIPSTQVGATETAYGIETQRVRSDGGRGSQGTGHFIMPNVHYLRLNANTTSAFRRPERFQLGWQVPIDDERVLSVHVMALPPATSEVGDATREYVETRNRSADDPVAAALLILGGEGSVHEIDDSPIVVNVQDYVSQIGQGVIRDRSRDHLGRSDAGVILMRQIYRREMSALAEGRPLKQWTNVVE